MSVTTPRATIAELEELLAGLPADARAAAGRIFAVTSTVGKLVPPPGKYSAIASTLSISAT